MSKNLWMVLSWNMVDLDCLEIKPVDIDRLFRFEIIGHPKNIGFINMEEFYYLIPSMSLKEGLRTCHNDFQYVVVIQRRLVVYLVHIVNVANVVAPEMSALPCPFKTTQQSNLDPISITKSDGEECCQKGSLDGSTSTIGYQNFKGTREKHTPTKSPKSRKKQKAHNIGPTEEPIQQAQTPTPFSQHLLIPIFHLLPPQLKNPNHISHNTCPIFSVKNDHGDSLSEKYGDGEYAIETELDLEAFEDIVGSISKTTGKRKINCCDDDGFENDGDHHDLDTDVDDEWETDVENVKTSDKELASAKAKVAQCKRQKVSLKTAIVEKVGKGHNHDMDKAKSSTTGNEQTHLGSGFYSGYENFKAEIDTDGETDDEVPGLLKRKERHVKMNKHIGFKKLKWQVGTTFETVERFKMQYLDIPSSSRPQSMTGQSSPLIPSQALAASSSSQPFINPP
ncbi:LOW QUALITY PROTEIN: hypothetical protein Cgig2_026390 [Carnegiea gigantea]|uniref:Uncharacterized protein n=1 Tax=Carnegiea gigantea TaxID=171969 RepID=A0A9Q1QAQ5_9CARY|nr:LOW QUALITY PROTEIN: hypothetical protein Cgig2_026390 [Carnegiea gigantea]